jgi:hypothetical protein
MMQNWILSHFYKSKLFFCKHKYKGGGKEWADIADHVSLNRNFMEHGHWAAPCLSWLKPHAAAGINSHKMAMNLGSVSFNPFFSLQAMRLDAKETDEQALEYYNWAFCFNFQVDNHFFFC